MRTRLLIGIMLVLLLSPALALAANAPATNSLISPVGTLVADLYSFSLKIVGLCVFVMFLLAGLSKMIPALKSRVGDTTTIIQNAIIGTVLLFSAYLILNTINPALVGNPPAVLKVQRP